MIVGGQTEARAQLSSTIMSRLTRALVKSSFRTLLMTLRSEVVVSFVNIKNLHHLESAHFLLPTDEHFCQQQ